MPQNYCVEGILDMGKRRKILLIALPLVIAAIIGAVLLTRTPQTTPESSPPIGSPPENPETPPNILVIPEVPLGTIAILLACFFALFIVQKRSKGKLP